MGYFLINEDVVDRTDLNLEEKMACVVLARFADIKVLQALLSLDIISVKMGCSIQRAEGAIEGLIRKGVLKSTENVISPIMPKLRGDKMPPYVYQSLENETKGSPMAVVTAPKAGMALSGEATQKTAPLKIDQGSIQTLKDYFEEIVSEAHIKLILNLTKGHIEPAKKAYDQCRVFPSNQRLEKLVESLQRVEIPQKIPVPHTEDLLKAKPPVVKELSPKVEPQAQPSAPTQDEDYEALFQELGSSNDIKQLNQQINVKRIKQMYGTYGKKP